MEKRKKILGILLVAGMLMSITACGKSSVSGGTAAAMDPDTPYPKTVTLTTGVYMDGGVSIPGQTYTKNGLVDFIKKKLNIQWKVAWEAIPQEYDTKLSLSIASDTLPDVFSITGGTDYLTFQQLAKAGKLADLTQADEKCWGGASAKIRASIPKAFFDSVTVNGKRYMLASPSFAFNDVNFLWVRKDWMNKVGATTLPKTADEIGNLAKKFVDAKLGKNGKTVGIVTTPIVSGTNPSGPWGWGYAGLGQVSQAYGAYMNFWMKDSDNKVFYGEVQPEMKDALTEMNKWYTEGVLDPQWATYKSMDDSIAVLTAGSAGMIFAPWWFPMVESSMIKTDPGVEWVPDAAPVDSNGKFMCPDETTFTATGGLVVNAKCKNPEAVVKSNNLIMDVENHKYDSEPLLKPIIQANEGLWPVSPGNIDVQSQNRNLLNAKAAKAYAESNGSSDYKFDPLITQSDVTGIKTGYTWSKSKDMSDATGWMDYYAYFPGQEINIAPEVQTYQVAWRAPTESQASLFATCETLLVTSYTQMICGQKPLSDFDSVVAQWKKAGGTTMTNEVQQQVNNLKK